MSEQAQLRRYIKALETMQEKRVVMVERKKADLDACVEKEQRKIDNLKQQLTIGVVK